MRHVLRLTTCFSDRDELGLNVSECCTAIYRANGALEPLTAGFSQANFLLISLRCSKVGSEEEKHNKAVLETAENKKQIGRKKDCER